MRIVKIIAAIIFETVAESFFHVKIITPAEILAQISKKIFNDGEKFSIKIMPVTIAANRQFKIVFVTLIFIFFTTQK